MPHAAEATLVTKQRLHDLIEEQEAFFLERQPESKKLGERAVKSLAGGATSSWQSARPQTVWISHGSGSKVWDVDGMEYVDLHGGYGVNVVGHAHPLVARAIAGRANLGTHFAQPTPDAVVVAEELACRFGLPLWRFGNSGTEATMDAFHLMRSITGCDLVIKIEGCYHGHHDSAMVSVAPSADELGPARRPHSGAAGSGLPKAITALTRVAQYNDVGSVERILKAEPGRVAGMILEPVMMNAGIIGPNDGYLATLKDLLHCHDALLAFDEVKTGLTIGPGGATALFGVKPDIVCLAKALGGGVPCGAIGGTARIMQHIANDGYEQVGTFNGNPLTMATARVVVTEVLTDDAYNHLSRQREQMVNDISAAIEEFELPGHVVAFGAKGCVTFSPMPVQNYRDYLEIDDDYSHLHWLYQHNGGVFLPPWGKAEQWTLSVQHTDEDAQRFVENFRCFAEALAG